MEHHPLNARMPEEAAARRLREAGQRETLYSRRSRALQRSEHGERGLSPMNSPPKNAKGGRQAADPTPSHDSVAPRLSDASQNGERELSYREIYQIMGRNLRVIPQKEAAAVTDKGKPHQLELWQ